MKSLELPLLLATCVWLTACAPQQIPMQRPAVTLPEKWEAATEAIDSPATPWWTNFNDPQLNALIEQALRNNNDVAAAAIRVRRAQLQADLVETNRTPAVAAGVNTGLTHSFSPAATSRTSGISAAFAYEPDLWGKLASQRHGAAWEAQASAADCHAYAHTLTNGTARLYWQVAYLNQLIALSEADIGYAQKTLDLVHTKHTAGLVSGLSAAQSELYLASLQASHTQLLQQRTEARHALAILFNQPPESTVAERNSLPETPLPAIATGIPAAILANRPDLNAAELRLRASLSNIEASRASFYPTLTLTGSLGTASNALLSLLQNPVATLGAGLALPFLQWNTTKLNIRVSENQYEEAVVNFRQRLLVALAEVEDGLSARSQLMAEADKLELALAQARRAESISRLRYQSGVTEVQLWLDAQQSLRSTERSVVTNRFNQFNNQANLYRALGLGTTQENASACDTKRS